MVNSISGRQPHPIAYREHPLVLVIARWQSSGGAAGVARGSEAGAGDGASSSCSCSSPRSVDEYLIILLFFFRFSCKFWQNQEMQRKTDRRCFTVATKRKGGVVYQCSFGDALGIQKPAPEDQGKVGRETKQNRPLKCRCLTLPHQAGWEVGSSLVRLQLNWKTGKS